MRFTAFALALLVTVPAPGSADATEPKPRIDRASITVSGISAGAAMAQQLHLAYPDLFSGAGVLAGVPWGCAEGSLPTALGRCTTAGNEPLPIDSFVERYRAAAKAGRMGDEALLAGDRAWVFHGSRDVAVAESVSRAAEKVYASLLPAEHVAWVGDIPAAHVFPTLDAGHACDAMEPPFIGNCGYDAAGTLLQFLYPDLAPPDRGVRADLRRVTLPDAAAAGLAETAWQYVPEACPEGGCRLHLVLHGCNQSESQVGRQFMEQAGYLPWAAANGIVLAFPQVAPSPVNPLACWDWWGYTGANYLHRDAPQMQVLAAWIHGMTE